MLFTTSELKESFDVDDSLNKVKGSFKEINDDVQDALVFDRKELTDKGSDSDGGGDAAVDELKTENKDTTPGMKDE